jgi:ATP-dependent Clp protease ATP-binding subunit ClpA
LGYDDTPVFEAVTNNPYTVFIFDELDKAHPAVLKTFMSILDEGRCASRKELADHTREFDFRHCVFIFTSNFCLGAPPQKRIGFSMAEDVADISYKDNAIEVSYNESDSQNDAADDLTATTKRVYRDTESARKAFVKAGVLREIASRFNCFVEFRELSEEAKVQILAKQVIETGFEYNIRLAHIAPPLLQALIDASTAEDALTVRSFKSVIEGYLAAAFAEAGASCPGQTVRLEGSIEAPILVPA